MTAVPGFNSVLSWRIVATTKINLQCTDYCRRPRILGLRLRVQLHAILANYCTQKFIYSALIIEDVLVYEASDDGCARVQLRAVLANYCNKN